MRVNGTTLPTGNKRCIASVNSQMDTSWTICRKLCWIWSTKRSTKCWPTKRTTIGWMLIRAPAMPRQSPCEFAVADVLYFRYSQRLLTFSSGQSTVANAVRAGFLSINPTMMANAGPPCRSFH